MVADQSSRGAISDASVATDAAIVDSSSVCLALVVALSDGKRHALRELAMRVLVRHDDRDVASVWSALQTFHAVGMPLVLEDDAVTAKPFAALAPHELQRHVVEASAPRESRWRVQVIGSTEST